MSVTLESFEKVFRFLITRWSMAGKRNKETDDLVTYPDFVLCLRQDDLRILSFGRGVSRELLVEIKEVVDNILQHKDHIEIDGLELVLKDIPIEYTCRDCKYISNNVRMSFSMGFILPSRVRIHFLDHSTFYEYEMSIHKYGVLANKDTYNSVLNFMSMIVRKLELSPYIVRS